MNAERISERDRPSTRRATEATAMDFEVVHMQLSGSYRSKSEACMSCIPQGSR
jgi:hypothetical protein